MTRLLRHKQTGDLYVWTPFLAGRTDMEPFTGNYPDSADPTYQASLPRVDSEVVRFRLSANGIGDAVCGIYAACGIADTGRPVEFFTKNFPWVKYASHPGVKILPYDESVFDANANYRQQMRDAEAGKLISRSHHYINNLKVGFGLQDCDPCRPKSIDRPNALNGKIVMAPFSTHQSRDWLHWRRLAMLLKDLPLVAIGIEKQQKEIEHYFFGLPVEIKIDCPPNEVIELVSGAACVIGNDSGMMHLAGFYGSKAICLMAQFDPEYTFYCSPSVEWIVPDMSCVGCHTVADAGWDPDCLRMCSALQTITPDKVAQQVRKYV